MDLGELPSDVNVLEGDAVAKRNATIRELVDEHKYTFAQAEEICRDADGYETRAIKWFQEIWADLWESPMKPLHHEIVITLRYIVWAIVELKPHLSCGLRSSQAILKTLNLQSLPEDGSASGIVKAVWQILGIESHGFLKEYWKDMNAVGRVDITINYPMV